MRLLECRGSSVFVRRVSVAALSLGCALGCGGAYRPDPAELGSSPLSFEDDVSGAEPCTPGAQRVCRWYWRDAAGLLHCPESLQFCREDGAGYDVCGAFAVDEDGGARPSWADGPR